MDDSEASRTSEKRLEWLIGYDVSACAYSPDGKTLAVASLQSLTSVSLWDAQTHKLIRRLPKKMTNTFCVAFSPDGKTLAVGTSSHFGGDRDANYDSYVVVLWDWRTGRRLRSLRRHGGTIRSVAFAPDGKLIASGGDDVTVKLWNAQTGALMRALPLKSNYCGKVAFSPDGKTIAAAGELVFLWDSATGKLNRTLPGSQTLAFSPDGRTLSTADDGQVKLWRLK